MSNLARIFAAILVCASPSAFADGVLNGGFPQTVPSPLTPGAGPTNPQIANDDERAAFKAGREYVFTTGNNGTATQPGLPVAANNVLNARICNNGTKPYYIASFGRFFDTTSTIITEYFGAANPDVLSTAQAATLTGCGAVAPNTCNLSYGTNLLPGGAAQSDIAMSFGVGSVMTCAGAACVPSGNGLIYPGTKNEISKPRVLAPGKCFGQSAVGQGGNTLGGNTTISLIFRVYIYSDQ